MAAALLQGLENRFGDDYFLIVDVLKYIREPLAQIGFSGLSSVTAQQLRKIRLSLLVSS